MNNRDKLIVSSKHVLAAFCAGATILLSAASAQRVTVGENIHVSGGRPTFSHKEVWMAVDPSDSSRQLATAMAVSPERPDQISTFVYASRDGGRTWRETLDTGPLAGLSADQSCAYGPDGSAHYVVILCEKFAERCRLAAFRSSDGGLTWGPLVEFPVSRGVDRSYVAVDTTAGKYRGRVYVMAQIFPRSTTGERLLSSITLHRSLDAGASYGLPALKSAPPSDPVLHPGNTIVTADGTVVSVFREFIMVPAMNAPGRTFKDKPGEPNSFIKIIKSEDGGETLSAATTVAESTGSALDYSISTFPYLAVDRGSPHFKNRLYAVWPDKTSGRSRIMFSYSADGGKTWEQPKTVDDNVPRAMGGPDDFMPTVAVNRRGVVGVAWYDRRESADNLGWHVRFAASLDGGETFGPSVRVSSADTSLDKARWTIGGQTVPPRGTEGKPLDLAINLIASNYSAGHTAGMEADSAGVFRPLWVDNRTGSYQVWTAPVTVEAEAVPNGSKELSTYRDVSAKTIIVFTNASYDQATDTLTAEARLDNTSEETINGPVRVRALTLTSEIAGKLEVVGADNGVTGPGAVWDFTPQLKNSRLNPGEASATKRLTFRLTSLRPLREGNILRIFLVRMWARVLSGAPAP